MKKTLALLATALLTAAASAVTLTWNEGTGFTKDGDTTKAYGVVSGGGDFTMTLKFTYSLQENKLPTTSLFKFGSGAGSLELTSAQSMAIKAYAAGEGGTLSETKATTGGHFSGERLNGNKDDGKTKTEGLVNTLVLAFKQSNETTGSYTLNASITFATGQTESALISNGGPLTFGAGTLDWSEIALGSSADTTKTGSDLAITGLTIEAASVAPVPEPTALALLALGVAGLALRRRTR